MIFITSPFIDNASEKNQNHKNFFSVENPKILPSNSRNDLSKSRDIQKSNKLIPKISDEIGFYSVNQTTGNFKEEQSQILKSNTSRMIIDQSKKILMSKLITENKETKSEIESLKDALRMKDKNTFKNGLKSFSSVFFGFWLNS